MDKLNISDTMYTMNLRSLVSELRRHSIKHRKLAFSEKARIAMSKRLNDELQMLLNKIDVNQLTAIRGGRKQKDLAYQAKVSQSRISRIEAGNFKGVSLEALQRILQVYLEIASGSASKSSPRLCQEGGSQDAKQGADGG